MYRCNRCERSFTCRRDLKHHTDERKTVCRKPTHYCDRCGKGLASYQSLWNHKQRCGKAKCEKCGADFSRLDVLTRHMIYHCKEKTAGEMKKIGKFIDGSDVTLKSGYNDIKEEQSVTSGSSKSANKVTLKWDGDSWQSIDGVKHQLYRINLGRDLDNLLKKHAIREDVLTCRQIENLNMYRKLFE